MRLVKNCHHRPRVATDARSRLDTTVAQTPARHVSSHWHHEIAFLYRNTCRVFTMANNGKQIVRQSSDSSWLSTMHELHTACFIGNGRQTSTIFSPAWLQRPSMTFLACLSPSFPIQPQTSRRPSTGYHVAKGIKRLPVLNSRPDTTYDLHPHRANPNQSLTG